MKIEKLCVKIGKNWIYRYFGKGQWFKRFEDIANCLCTSKYTVLVLVGFWLMFGVEIWELSLNYWRFMISNFILKSEYFCEGASNYGLATFKRGDVNYKKGFERGPNYENRLTTLGRGVSNCEKRLKYEKVV